MPDRGASWLSLDCFRQNRSALVKATIYARATSADQNCEMQLAKLSSTSWLGDRGRIRRYRLERRQGHKGRSWTGSCETHPRGNSTRSSARRSIGSVREKPTIARDQFPEIPRQCRAAATAQLPPPQSGALRLGSPGT